MNEKTKNISAAAEVFRFGALILGSFLILFGTINKVFSFAALILYTLLIVFGDEELSIMSMVYMMPFAALFKSAPGSISFYTYITLIYVAKQLATAGHLPISLLPFMAYIVMGQCAAQNINIFRTLKLFSGLMFVYYAFVYRDKYSEKKIFFVYITAMILSSIFRLMDSNTFRLTRYFDDLNMMGDVIRFSGLKGDPNAYSINVIISMCLLIVMYEKKQISAVTAIVFSAVFVYFVIITYSKSSLLMLAIPLAALVYINRKNRKYLMQAALLIAASVVVAFALSGRIRALDIVMARFTDAEGDLNKLTTGRVNLWIWYIDYYISNPRIMLFGGGLGAGLIHHHGVHNTYLQAPYYIGVVGEIWLFSVLRSIIGTDNKKKTFLNYSVLISVLVMYFFLSELFDYQAPIHLLIAGLVLKDPFQQEDCVNEEKGIDNIKQL